MKKKFLSFLLAICFVIPCMLMFSACSITTPEVGVRVSEGYIQYNNGESWTNVVALEELESEQGFDLSGKDIEFQVSKTHIQCRSVGGDEWFNLIAIDVVIEMAFDLMDSLDVGKIEAKE